MCCTRRCPDVKQNPTQSKMANLASTVPHMSLMAQVNEYARFFACYLNWKKNKQLNKMFHDTSEIKKKIQEPIKGRERDRQH